MIAPTSVQAPTDEQHPPIAARQHLAHGKQGNDASTAGSDATEVAEWAMASI